MFPRIAAVSIVLVALALPLTAATRITYDIQGAPKALEWPPTAFPLRFEIDNKLTSLDSRLPAMIADAFKAWQSIPEANVRFESRGMTNDMGKVNDGRVVVSRADDLFRGQGALAMTTYTFDQSGRFLDADIQIDPALITGDTNIEMALRHEVGHVLGLDHSAVLSAVMFPYVSTDQNATGFDSDDRIAISAAYPKGDPTLVGATLQGRVMGDQGGIFAAQVVAVNERGEPVATSLTNSAGEFTLLGIPAGQYRIYAEPLDGPVEVNVLQGSWRQAKTVPFPTQFYEGPPIAVENGQVYGNLVVTASGAVQLNPRWVGVVNAKGDVGVASTPVNVKAGDVVTLAVAGDGFISGMTQFEVLNPSFRRISDFTWSANYVTAKFAIDLDAQTTSGVILVRNGRDAATLTGALRVFPSEVKRVRAVRR
jgi:Matrixin